MGMEKYHFGEYKGSFGLDRRNYCKIVIYQDMDHREKNSKYNPFKQNIRP